MRRDIVRSDRDGQNALLHPFQSPAGVQERRGDSTSFSAIHAGDLPAGSNRQPQQYGRHPVQKHPPAPATDAQVVQVVHDSGDEQRTDHASDREWRSSPLHLVCVPQAT